MAAGMALVGLKTAGAIFQGVQQAKQFNQDAVTYEEQAVLAQTQGSISLFKKKMDIKRYERQADAQVGMNSSSLSGSYLQNVNESFMNAELDLSVTKYNADLKSANYLTQASNARSASKMAIINGLLGAGGAVLSGVDGGEL